MFNWVLNTLQEHLWVTASVLRCFFVFDKIFVLLGGFQKIIYYKTTFQGMVLKVDEIERQCVFSES